MTTISRKVWHATEWNWKRCDMWRKDGIPHIHYFLMLAGKFREVALVD